MIYFITFFLLVNISSLLKNARSYKNSKVLLDVECFHRPNFPTHLLRLSLGPSKGEIFNRKIFPLLDMDPKFGHTECRFNRVSLCTSLVFKKNIKKEYLYLLIKYGREQANDQSFVRHFHFFTFPLRPRRNNKL